MTGATGYVASWVVCACFQKGYRVRGTVRNIANTQKIQHLIDLAEEYHAHLELIETDLLADDRWDAAVADCDFIFHLACPNPSQEPKNPQEEMIRPALEGTKRLLAALSRRQTPPRRMVMTSSVTAIAFGTNHVGKVYSDNDWTCLTSSKYPLSAYSMTKTLSERAAWDFVAALPAEKRFELVAVNPTFAVGPMLSKGDCTSAALFRKILMAEIPGLVNMTLDLVSIVDVARVHLLALTHPEAAGKRILVHSPTTPITMQEISVILRKEFSHLGYSPSSFVLSDWIIRTAALSGDADIKAVLPIIGIKRVLDAVNLREVLGYQTRTDVDSKALVLEMVHAGFHAGVIPDKSPNKSLSTNYIRPKFNLICGERDSDSGRLDRTEMDGDISRGIGGKEVEDEFRELRQRLSGLEGRLEKESADRQTEGWYMKLVIVVQFLLFLTYLLSACFSTRKAA